ncbi:MAG: branched-chain amino acid transport system permease protein [Natronomonas sp.]|jgi:branched-chain amino acid transport system permease protein|uniref:branched-chain amino acid ABC transporter permease n=1 Tax=Natronomonas sp. TaxID=2184060 RepID=UPI0039895625
MATKTPFEGDVEERRKQAIKEKLQLSELPLRHRLGLVGLVLLALSPVAMRPLELNQFTYVLFLMMFAVSWDVVSGYTGQLSFGHAFFFALGGYTTSVATVQHGVHPFIGIALATILAAIGGLLIGVPALRLEGPYLSLVTLIAPLLLYQMFILFSTKLPYLAPDGLGGTSGLTDQPQQIVGFAQDAMITTQSNMLWAMGRFYVAFIALLIVFAVAFAVTRSSAGTVFTAIREDENAVRSAGKNPAKFKIFAFVLAGAIGGFAAAVWMHTGGFPNTENLFGPGRIDLSINVIVMVIIGGMGTIVGPVVGALLFAATEVFVNYLTFTVPLIGIQLADLTPLPVFLIAMLTLVFIPEGAVPRSIKEGRKRLARYRGEEPPEPEEDTRTPSESIVAKYREEIEDMLGRDNK